MQDAKVRKTFLSLLIGATIYNAILIIVSTIAFIMFSNDKSLMHIIKNELCIIIGCVFCYLGIYFMTISLIKSLDSNDESFAKRHMAISSIIRSIVFCVAFVIISNKNVFGIVGGLLFALSVLGIKVGAYMAAFIEKRI